MHAENSFCVAVYNRCLVPIKGKEPLTPLPTLIKSILAQEDIEKSEVVIVDFYSDDTDYSWLKEYHVRHIIMRLPEPFNLGKGRNIGAMLATGKRLFMLDCDMRVPKDFVKKLKIDIDTGNIVFPLYKLTNQNGVAIKEGSGWGNVALSKVHWLECNKRNIRWLEKTTYGGEDTAFAGPIVKRGLFPYKRYLIDGFEHVWHPKATSTWYVK